MTENAIIVYQDEQIDGWKTEHKSNTNSTIQHSVLGRVKAKLGLSNRTVMLERWMPTTQHCFECGTNTVHTPDKRTFECSVCGHTEDRDIHAAQNMIKYYLSYLNLTKTDTPGTGDTVKPANRRISYKDLCGKQEDAISLVLH